MILKISLKNTKYQFRKKEIIFLAALCIYVVYGIINMSTFYPPYLMTKIIRFVCICIICCKCFCFDKIKINSAVCLMLLFVFGLIIKLKVGAVLPIMTCFFIVGAYDVSFDAIVQCFFRFGSITLLFVFVSSQIGIIPDLIFDYWGIERHACGYFYTTDFVHQLFFLVISHVYINRNKSFKLNSFFIYVLLGVFTYIYSRSRLGSGCIILAAMIYIYIHKLCGGKANKIFGFFAKYSVLFFATLTIVASAIYNPQNIHWKILDKALSGRLSLCKHAFEKYDLSLFGEEIKMVGAGIVKGINNGENEYFYLDSAYVYTLFCFGVLCFIMLVLGYTFLLCREYKKKNYVFCLIGILIALHGSISAQMIILTNNIFLLSFFANINSNDRVDRYTIRY